MKKLKIALFIDVYYPMVDGVVVVVDNYAKRLAEFSDVTVFCPKPKEKVYDDTAYNYLVERCRSLKIKTYDYPIGLPFFDRKFRRALKSERFDIVHIHSPFFVSRLGVKYAKSHKIPLVATLHSQFKQDFHLATKSKFLTSALLKFAMMPFNKCDECWAVNGAIKEIFTKDYGVTAPCRVQPNATDLVLQDYEEASKVLNEKFGINENENLLVFSGRLVELKNIFFIAEGLKKVKDQGVNFRMAFIGTGSDENRLKEKIKELGIENEVIFTGRITDRTLLSMFYRRASVFLFPSLYDASSLVQIEAASQKTPTLFIRGSATSATAEEDVSGILCENDVNDFANKIVKTLTDKEYLLKLSEGAYNNLYVTWDDSVKVAYERYIQLIEANKNSPA